MFGNPNAPIRIETVAPLEIVGKLGNRDVDPATIVLLYPLKIVKGKRQLLISGAGFMATHTKSDLQSKQLQSADNEQQPTAYCFGIDAPAK
jgi:hypothetical protein